MSQENGAPSEKVLTLLQPPTRLDRDHDGVVYACLTDAGEFEMRVWTAGSEREAEEIRRFEQAAAARVDWKEPGPHEVRWEPVDPTNPRIANPQGPRSEGPENEVFDMILLEVDDDSVPLPDAVALDEFERTSGFHLPESYRRFVLRFGPGTFDSIDEVSVASPGYPKTYRYFDLARLNRADVVRDWPDDEIQMSFGPNVARVRRLILFATTSGGDRYGWDPLDLTDESAHECGVYLLPRHGKPLMRRTGKNFVEFVATRGFRRNKSRAYRAHLDVFIRQYDIAQLFLDETSWPLKPGQDVGDFAHGMHGELHCSPRSKLSTTFKKWLKARFGPKAEW